MEIVKIDDNTVEVTKTESTTTKNIFTYEYLISQRDAIQAMKDRDNLQRDLELAEVDSLISESEKIGVSFKIEPVEEKIL